MVRFSYGAPLVSLRSLLLARRGIASVIALVFAPMILHGCTGPDGLDSNGSSIVVSPPSVTASCYPNEFRTGSLDVRCETTDASGLCVDGATSSLSPGPAGGVQPFQPPPGPEAVCNSIDLSSTTLSSKVVFLVDRSCSMDHNFAPGVTRWEAVEEALFGASGVISTDPGDIEFGIAFFSCKGGGEVQDLVLPASNTVPGHLAALEAAYHLPFSCCTATAHAINALYPMLDPGTSIVLATDGAPTDGKANTEDAATASFLAGNMVHGLSVGSGTSVTHMSRVVTNGTGGAYTAPIVATDPASLTTALSTLVSRATPSCDQALSVPPFNVVSGCSFNVSGTPVPQDVVDGWSLPDSGTLRFNGDSCTRLEAGDPIVGECSCAEYPEPSTGTWEPELEATCPEGLRASWTDTEVGWYAIDSTNGMVHDAADPIQPTVTIEADITNPITGDAVVPRVPVPVMLSAFFPQVSYDAGSSLYTVDLQATVPGGNTVFDISNLVISLIPTGYLVPVLTHFAMVYECVPVE